MTIKIYLIYLNILNYQNKIKTKSKSKQNKSIIKHLTPIHF